MDKRVPSLNDFISSSAIEKESEEYDVVRQDFLGKVRESETAVWVAVSTPDGKYIGWVFPKKGDIKLFVYPTSDSSANPIKTKSGKTLMVKVSEITGTEQWPF